MEMISACPSCGDVAKRDVYDIGSGPELSCASCEWCWGAQGQDLQPLDFKMVLAQVAESGCDGVDDGGGLEEHQPDL